MLLSSATTHLESARRLPESLLGVSELWGRVQQQQKHFTRRSITRQLRASAS